MSTPEEAMFLKRMVELIIGAAESALGVQYQWGGNSLATGVDCSGLVQQAYKAAGINLPRVSADQARSGKQIGSIADAQAGDLLSWDNSSRNAGADHIAIYIGNGMMIESPRSGEAVRVVPVRPGASVTRVLGVVQAGDPMKVTLGANTDRKYATAAVTGAQVAPTATVAAANAPENVAQPGVTGGLGDDLPPNATDEQVEAYIRAHYMDVAPFLANPEIRQLAFDAARTDMAPSELAHRFQQTEYYRTHGPTSRALDELIGTDMQAAVQAIDKAKELIGDLFSRNGVDINDHQLGEVAKQAIRNGWIDLEGGVSDPAKLHDFLAFSIGATGKPLQGEAAATADNLGALARQYGITMARGTLEEWSLKIEQGQASEDSFKAYVTNMARGVWQNDADLQRALDSGITPDAYFDPYRQTIAGVLGLSPDQVDIFNDPRWKQVTQVFDPRMEGGKGGTRTMTLAETAQFARDQPEYKDTMAYKESDASTGVQLAQFLGMVK